MFKDVLQHMDLGTLMKAAMVIFFACFVAVVAWALSRPARQVGRWSRLPLEGEEHRGQREETAS